LLVHVKSDIGLVRGVNEDSYICEPPHLFAVADGMGGHAAGEIASNLAITKINSYIQENGHHEKSQQFLEKAIVEANTAIYQLAQSKDEYNGMGTTVTAIYIDGNKIYWAQVGDSRLYLLRNEEFIQITDDHSLVWELVQSGNMTKEEALIHPKRNMLTRAVGTSASLKIDTGIISWEIDDILLLCTDGLTNMVSEQQIYNHINNRHGDVRAIIDELVVQANHAGGSDNITAILIKNGDV